jgi:hypothetical protein
MPLACFPPFDSICILSLAALVGIVLANRMGATPSTADPAARKPVPQRVWVFAAVYGLFIVALFAFLLRLGIAIDP